MRYLAGVAFVLVMVSAASATNLLTNPGLETPTGESVIADGWTLIAPTPLDPTDPGYPESPAMFEDWAGSVGRGLWFKSFLGGAKWHTPLPGPANATLTQDVAGNAGDAYALSAYFKFEKYYSGLNELENTQTLLAIDYLDAGSNLLSSNVLDVDAAYAPYLLPGGFGDGNFHQFSVAGVAPAGTAFVRARAQFIDGTFSYYVDTEGNWHGLDPQSAMVDEFVLTPEPASLAGLLLLALLRRR